MSTTPTTTPSFAGSLESYEKLIATNPNAERKGATMPYTSVNGHMFSFLTKTGKLALRLPEAGRAAFCRKYNPKPCEQNGAVLKEYVEVPDSLLAKTQELKEFFDVSYTYAASLKPKPARAKRKP